MKQIRFEKDNGVYVEKRGDVFKDIFCDALEEWCELNGPNVKPDYYIANGAGFTGQEIKLSAKLWRGLVEHYVGRYYDYFVWKDGRWVIYDKFIHESLVAFTKAEIKKCGFSKLKRRRSKLCHGI